jgi:hypothetical protein
MLSKTTISCSIIEDEQSGLEKIRGFKENNELSLENVICRLDLLYINKNTLYIKKTLDNFEVNLTLEK